MASGEAIHAARGLKKTALRPDVPPPDEVHQVHAAEQRGALDNERQHRVFDPKVRTIGIDRQLLDDQIKERQDMRQLEKRRDAEYDKAAVQMNKHQQALQHECDLIRLQRERDVEKYRSTFQKKEGRREFDLNDPKGKNKDLPARIGDNDPRCGPSSMQKFSGEDLDAAERRRRQAMQMRDWTQKQQEEKAMRKWVEDERNRQWEARAEEVNKKVWDLEQLQKAQRRQATQTTAEFNRRLAEQKRRDAAAQRQQDTLNSLEEIQNNLDSDFLGETSTAAGAGRRERFKGLPKDHLQAIRNEQGQQQEELRQRRIREREEELADHRREEHERKMGTALEAQMTSEYRQLDKRIDDDRKLQAAAQREQHGERSRLYASEIGEQRFRPHLPASAEICASIGKSTR